MSIGLGLILGSVAPGRAASPVSVTTCGQVVTGAGSLVADLDCSVETDDAVKLNGRLFLNGFMLTGNSGFDVVRCVLGPCGVVGPGTVTGGLDGVRSDRGARVEDGAIVTGNAGDGVRTDLAAKVIDATISANGGDCVRTDRTANVKTSTVTGNAGNGVDSDTTAKATTTSFVTANGFDGLKGLRVVLSNSTATGNGTNVACTTIDDCADLAAALRPSVRGLSTCGTGRNTEAGGTWGVCPSD